MAPTFVACEIFRDGSPIRSETVLYESGLRVLTIATTTAEFGMQLISTYTGDDALDTALVAEAIEWPEGDEPELRTRGIQVPPGFTTHRRDLALDDHLNQFCALAAEVHQQSFEVVSRQSIDAVAGVGAW